MHKRPWLLLISLVAVLASCRTPDSSSKIASDKQLVVTPGPTVKATAVATPLSTCGRWVIDANGKRFKIAGVNWYGASDTTYVVGGLNLQSLDTIASAIVSLGFNAVRLPFSNDLLRATNPVDPAQVAANPNLVDLTPLQVYDQTVAALTRAGLAVILDNHQTHPSWCCSLTDNNGLWYTYDFTYDQWISDWKMMAGRYLSNPLVIGAELRNEVRSEPTSELISTPLVPVWGVPGPLNWPSAATEAGNAVLSVNPNLLVIVDGLNFADDLTGVSSFPITLKASGHLVYAAHNYGYFSPTPGQPQYGQMSEAQFAQKVGHQWGYIVAPNKSYTAPVFLSEFGDSADGNKAWLTRLVNYLDSNDLDWAFWPLNASPSGTGRVETYALLQPDWKTPKADFRIPLIQAIQTPTQGPGVGTGPDNNCPSPH